MKISHLFAALAALIVTIGISARPATAQTRAYHSSTRTIEAGGAAARTIEVSGDGEARAKPDWATLNLAIQTTAATAAEAAGKNAALAQKVLAALRPVLGERGKIVTGGYSLYPQYETRPAIGEKPSIIGYNVQNSITVETGSLDSVGKLIDAAVGAGANRVNFLNLTLKDDTKARSEAIAAATRDAHAQANAIAAAMGVRLGKILHATTVAPGARPMPVGRMSALSAQAAMAEAATPIEGGEVTVRATVYLTYAIE